MSFATHLPHPAHPAVTGDRRADSGGQIVLQMGVYPGVGGGVAAAVGGRVPGLLRCTRRRGLAHLAGLLLFVSAGLLLLAPNAQAQARPATPASAALPAVPDPKDWAQLNPIEQERRRMQIRQQLQAATPEQRQAYRQALRQRLESLSPDERQNLAGQLRHRWNDMPPEERTRLQQERREAIRALPPEERRALIQERRQMLDKLSPEERRALREKLPAP